MLFKIDPKVLENYPQAEIGYLIAQVSVKKSDSHVEELKKTLGNHLEQQGINATNFAAHPSIALWRNIYENDFHVKAKTYRSSIEALIRRVVLGKELWNICNVVDLYNSCSVLSLLPMGGYDLKKISGDIVIRFAEEGESFLGLGSSETITPKSNHVVYADHEKLLCFLWNHKDSKESSIDETTKDVVFFIDTFDRAHLQTTLELLEDHLRKIGGIPLAKGILNQTQPESPCF